MMTIGIIGGKGRMGAAFAEFFRAQGEKVLISDVRTKLSNIDVAKKADVVIVSVPIDQTEAVIGKIASKVKKGALLMDLTSVKEKPVNAMMKSKASVIGLHPMFNQTTLGPGQTIIYCPARPGKWTKWLKQTLGKSGGFHLIKMTPKKHDQTMSFVQGVIHFSEIALAKTLYDLKPSAADLFRFASPASQLQLKITARHLAQDPNLYGNIQIQNPRNQRVLNAYSNAIDELRGIVAGENLDEFIQYFKKGGKFFGKYGDKAFRETDQMIHRMIPAMIVEKPKKMDKKGIATLGPDFTNASFAAEKWKGKQSRSMVFLRTIEDIFEVVERGKVQEGVVPIENRLHGTVRETLDALFTHKVHIVGEVSLPIHHSIAMLPGAKREDVRVIISHSQALYQCSDYLKKEFPDAKWVTVDSTAAGFEHVKEEGDTSAAVIGPKAAAKHFGFKLLKQNIENDHSNSTTFIAISKKPRKTRPRRPKTSIVFYFHKDKPGSLLNVFQAFGDAKINLTKIESRPAPKKLGEYLFFIDFEDDPNSKKAKAALKQVKEIVAGMKVLGTY